MSKYTLHIPYTEVEIKILKEGGRRLSEILKLLGEKCVEGVTGTEIDALAEKYVTENGDIPVFKNYKPHGAKTPFPASICISINDVVAHGIPNDTPFKNGDVISLDLGFRHNGLVVDSAITIIVGGGDLHQNKLLLVTKKALEIGIAECRVGRRVGEVGIAIEKYVVENGFNVVDILCGHAVGRQVHADPQIPHADFGRTGENGIKIEEGMVLAIEPHISMGSGEAYLAKDNWAYKTTDKSVTAQFEHTILITKDGPVIFTN